MSGKYPGNFVSLNAPAGYSVAFDGTGDYLNLLGPGGFAFTLSDFTIEFWYYSNTSGVQQVVYDSRPSATNGAYMTIYKQTGNVFSVYVNSVARITGTTTILANTWYHVAVCRASFNTRLFINGVQDGSTFTSDTFSYLNGSGRPVIGCSGNSVGTDPVNGFVSNLRVLGATALYTTTFNPPTQLFNISGTTLLTCNSPAIIDQSNAAYAITVNGDAKVSTFTPFTAYTSAPTGFNPVSGAAAPGVWTLSQAEYYQNNRLWPIYDPSFNQTTLMLHGNLPFSSPPWVKDASYNNFAITVAGDTKASALSPFSKTTYPTSGSAYFDGTGDELSIADNAAWNLTGDFTIEAWVYPTVLNTNNEVCSQWGGVGNAPFIFKVNSSGRPVFIWTIGGGTGNTLTGTSTAVGLNTWNHVAVSRSGNTIRLFVNGVTDATTATTSGSITNGTNSFYIGSLGGSEYFTGYMSNLRLVNGTALYTGDYTIPTAPLSLVANTQLLTLQNAQPTNSSSYTDSSSNNYAIAPVGNAAQGTASPFRQPNGYWSVYFPGSNYQNVRTSTASADFNFSTGDFCIEFFYTPNTLPTGTSFQYLWSAAVGTTANCSGFLYGDGKIYLEAASATNLLSATHNMTVGNTYHIAYVRSGSTYSIYLNGNLLGSIGTGTISGASSLFYMGTGSPYSVPCNGNMSNVRVTKGQPVYTAAFTPTTSPLTTTSQGVTAANVSLLTLQSNYFVDNSTANPKTLVVGDNSANLGVRTILPSSPFASNTVYAPSTIGGSVYLNGSTDYLTTPQLTPGTGPFTFECWFYYTGDFTAIAAFCGPGVVSTGSLSLYINNSTQLAIQRYGFTAGLYTVPAIAAYTWNHVVFVRDVSGNMTVFLNGTRSSTGATVSTSNIDYFAVIGYVNSTVLRYFPGSLSNVRYANTALYDPTQTTITVPTAPLTAVSGTQLLLNCNNSAVVDNAVGNNFVTVGNAQITTIQSKYGGASVFFNGTSNGLACPGYPQFNFTSNDFTVEFWMNLSATPTAQMWLMSAGPNGSGAARRGWGVRLNDGTTSGLWFVYQNASAAQVNNFGSLPALNTWTHVAFSRNGTVMRCFVNGVQYGSTWTLPDTSFQALATTDYLGIGGYDQTTQNGIPGRFWYSGYLDDIRITTGVGRYLGNFTAPTSQLQDQ